MQQFKPVIKHYAPLQNLILGYAKSAQADLTSIMSFFRHQREWQSVSIDFARNILDSILLASILTHEFRKAKCFQCGALLDVNAPSCKVNVKFSVSWIF